MNTLDISLEQLRGMIGLRVIHLGSHCQVVEVLEDGPALVLLDLEESHSTIQADQHGEAHRRVPVTYTIPVLNPDATGFSADFLALEPLGKAGDLTG